MPQQTALAKKLDDQKRYLQITVNTAAKQSKEVLALFGFTPEAYARIVLNAILRNPKLIDCSSESMRTAVLECAQNGLLPDGESASIVPYKNKAQLVIGYKGMCDLVRRSIRGIVLRANVVTEDDEFEYTEGLHPTLNHVRSSVGDTPNEKNIIAVYATAKLPGNDAPEFIVMFKNELDHIRRHYTHPSSTPWMKEYAEQAKKTAMRRLCKMLPMRSGLMSLPPTEEPVDEEPEPVVVELGQDQVDEEKPKRQRRTRKMQPVDEPSPPPQPEMMEAEVVQEEEVEPTAGDDFPTF